MKFAKKNNWFEIRNTTEDRGQSIPKSIGILTVLRCILVQIWKSFNQWWLITWTNSQSQNGVNFYFEVNLTLKVSQSPPKTSGIFTKVFYTYGPNLVILAETVAELSCGQARYWRTHGRTHRQMDTHTQTDNDNTRRPKQVSVKNAFWMALFHSQDFCGQNQRLPVATSSQAYLFVHFPK